MLNVAFPGYLHADILAERYRKSPCQGKINRNEYTLHGSLPCSSLPGILEGTVNLWKEACFP